METKNIKTQTIKSTVKLKESDSWQRRIPTCPLCGNTEMNYYITEKKVWKCSKAHLHGDTRIIESLLKHVA